MMYRVVIVSDMSDADVIVSAEDKTEALEKVLRAKPGMRDICTISIKIVAGEYLP